MRLAYVCNYCDARGELNLALDEIEDAMCPECGHGAPDLILWRPPQGGSQ